MAVSVLRGNVVSAVEPLVEALIERATDIPDITLDHLMEKIVGLLGEQVVRDIPDARIMLERKLSQIDARNREEPVGLNEQRFYNLSCDLIDTAGRVNTWCIERLREINLGEGAQDDMAFRAYQIEIRERLILQRVGKILGTFNYDKAATDILGMRSMEHFQNFLATEVDSLHFLPLAQSLIRHDKARAERLISTYFPPFRVPVPKIAFGKDAWEKYFGDVGEEPPLPTEIFEILKSPCPYLEGKTIEDTHLLVLIPKTINKKSYTIGLLGEMIKNPQNGGYVTKYHDYNNPSILGLKDKIISESYWVLMTKDVIPNSRNKSFSEQQVLIRTPYYVPRFLEMATGILTYHVRTGNKLYPNPPDTYTRCQDRLSNGDGTVVGSFSDSIGLYMCHSSQSTFSTCFVYAGIGGIWKI